MVEKIEIFYALYVVILDIFDLYFTGAGDVKNQFSGASRSEGAVAVIRSGGEEYEIRSDLLVYETEPSGPMGRPPDQRSRD